MGANRKDEPRLDPERVARGDLGPPPAMCQLLQRFLERQCNLLCVPPTSEPRLHRLPARQLDPEAGEAQRSRPLDRRIFVVVAKPVPGFFFTTTRAKRDPARVHRSIRPTSECRYPPVVQRELPAFVECELLTSIHLRKRVSHIACPPHTQTVAKGCDRRGHSK